MASAPENRYNFLHGHHLTVRLIYGGITIMLRTKPQTTRLIELDRQIRAGKYPNCKGFAEQYEGVSQKTVQRDIEYLRDSLGAPVAYDFNRRGYHYTDQNWFLPALSLSEGELFAVTVAARAVEQYRGTPVAKDLERVFHKIAAALPERIALKPELVHFRFSFTTPPAKPVDPKIWSAVVRGLLHQRSVQITYSAIESKRDKPQLIDPYHLANVHGEWYVISYDHRVNAISRFAILDIKQAVFTGKYFQLPPDFDPVAFLATAFGRYALYGTVEEVKLHLDKEIVPSLLPSDWQPSKQVKNLPDGSVEITMRTANLFEVSRLVLGWGHHVKVIEPYELIKIVKDEIHAMAELPSKPTR